MKGVWYKPSHFNQIWDGTALLSEACSRSPYGLAKAFSGMHLR